LFIANVAIGELSESSHRSADAREPANGVCGHDDWTALRRFTL